MENDSYYINIEIKLLEELKARKGFESIKQLIFEEGEIVNNETYFKKFKIKTNTHFEVVKFLVEEMRVPVRQVFDYESDHKPTHGKDHSKFYKLKASYTLYSH